MSKESSSDTDFENIKSFYLAFKSLPDCTAAEERLWVGLCHYDHFWDYLKYRWPCQTEKKVLS